jgi:hypothetical protein
VIKCKGRYYPKTLSLEEAISKWDGKKTWLIKLSDMTVSMALWYSKCRTAQEVLECVKADVNDNVDWLSYTQLLAMEAAQKLALVRAVGRVDAPDSSRTWLVDLNSVRKEFDRIGQTGHIYANK